MQPCQSWNRVGVGIVDLGSGACLCALKRKCFQRFWDRCLFAIVAPGFTFCSCQENFQCLCCSLLTAAAAQVAETLLKTPLGEPAKPEGIRTPGFFFWDDSSVIITALLSHKRLSP